MMKHKILPLFLLLFLHATAKAAETEPNNTKAQANTLDLNGGNTGNIGSSTDVDWWKITTTSDGNLDVTIAISNGMNTQCTIYDNDGAAVLSQDHTSGTITISAYGLAAGTYYVKVYSNVVGDKPVYTILNALTQPGQINDAEPNNTRGQAINLPLNGSTEGHIGYYYSNNMDSVDWYKVTTNADGDLHLTVQSDASFSSNPPKVWADLYDNDGKTQLASGVISNEAVTVDYEGLAPGTYYIAVYPYDSYASGPYTLSDVLFKAPLANESEPNDSKANAATLQLNGIATGHVGYYYKNKRDSSDWYKLTTTADGMITINIQSSSGNSVAAYLYDNDGTTLLSSDYKLFSYDGLKAGTYYVKVKNDYNDFASYTLSNILSDYSYAGDGNDEPNNDFTHAKTIQSNINSTTGHAGFYYNGTTDVFDYFKINYTGTDTLTLAFSQENRIKYGSTVETGFQVFKDTISSPVYGGYFTSPTGDITLTGLTEGYYYIRVFPGSISPGESFSSYSIKNAFTQKDKAKIAITSTQPSADCTPSNSITYKLSKSQAPYKVQLYRFGLKYGSVVNVNGNTTTFSNLPPGSYYATVYGDGATGNAYSTSIVTTFASPVPTGLSAAAIKATQATLKWAALTCADYFTIQYRVQGAAIWTTINTTGNVTSYVLKGLTAGTNYEWQVSAVDSGNGSSVMSAYSSVTTFKTKASALIASDEDENADDISIGSENASINVGIAPNPAGNYFIIKYGAVVKDKVTATLYNANGKAVWNSGAVSADVLNNKKVIVSNFAGGLYYLKIADARGTELGNIKVSIIK